MAVAAPSHKMCRQPSKLSPGTHSNITSLTAHPVTTNTPNKQHLSAPHPSTLECTVAAAAQQHMPQHCDQWGVHAQQNTPHRHSHQHSHSARTGPKSVQNDSSTPACNCTWHTLSLFSSTPLLAMVTVSHMYLTLRSATVTQAKAWILRVSTHEESGSTPTAPNRHSKGAVALRGIILGCMNTERALNEAGVHRSSPSMGTPMHKTQRRQSACASSIHTAAAAAPQGIRHSSKAWPQIPAHELAFTARPVTLLRADTCAQSPEMLGLVVGTITTLPSRQHGCTASGTHTCLCIAFTSYPGIS